VQTEGSAVLLGVRGSRWRCLLVWVSGTSPLATVALLLRPEASRAWMSRGSLGALPLDRALVGLAAYALLACLTWGWLALSATVVDAWRGATATPRHRPWHPPEVVRRLVLAACGVALASAVAAPAVANDGAATHRHLHGAARLAGLPLPDRAVAPRRRTVVVRPGDSLWAIAQRDLRSGASDRAVASRWRAIYAANRARIGPDPDLLEPGQRLFL
jgi:LysM domain